MICTAPVSFVNSNNQKHLAAYVYAFALFGKCQLTDNHMKTAGRIERKRIEAEKKDEFVESGESREAATVVQRREIIGKRL